MSKTIIAPIHLHNLLFKKTLQNNEVVFNNPIIPLHAYINQITNIENNNYDKKLAEALINLKADLSILSAYVINETFVESIKSFHIDMHLYNIDLNSLSKQTSKDQDLLKIFTSIKELVPHEINIYNELKNILKSKDQSHVDIACHNYTSNLDKEIINLLLESGAQILPVQQYPTESVRVYFANNLRSEVEASAQYLVDNGIKNAQIIYLNDAYKEIIRSVYSRYNIHTNLDYENTETYNKRFLSIIKLVLTTDSSSVINFLSSNPLNLEKITYLQQLNDYYNFNLESLLKFEASELDDPLLNEREIKHYNTLLENSIDNINIIQNFINIIYSEDNITIVENIFNYLLEHHYDAKLNNISSTLFNNRDQIIKSDNLSYTIEKILLRKRSNKIELTDIVVCNTSEHEYFNKEHVLILGATNKNYPNLKSLAGVIDEIYVKNLTYPSKTKRFNAQLKNLEKMNNAKNLVIFYPLASNEGKSIEPAFSLLNYAKQYNSSPSRYPLKENDYYVKRVRSLTPEVSKSLFLRDNKLYGSISSIEQYNKCPYAYFLKAGLKIYPNTLPTLSAAYIGSVLHKVIEDVVQRKIDSVVDISDDEIICIINESFEALALLNDPKVDIVRKTLINHFLKTYRHLQQIDNSTILTPTHLEYEFSNYPITNNVIIRGQIDRIDQVIENNKRYLRIVDYKSSPRDLSETKLREGLQLQLLTYLIVASETIVDSELINVPLSAVYKTLRLQHSSMAPWKLTKSKPFASKNSKQDYLNNVINKNRASSWNFEFADVYNSAEFIKGLKLNKDEQVVPQKDFVFDTVKTVVVAIYEQTYNNICNGIIDTQAVDGACRFCDFRSVCQVRSSNFKNPVMMKDQKLNEAIDYLKGSDDNE